MIKGRTRVWCNNKWLNSKLVTSTKGGTLGQILQPVLTFYECITTRQESNI